MGLSDLAQLLRGHLVVGYTTQDHLMLDFDHTSHYVAKRLVIMIQRDYPDVGQALIVRSSPGHYHVVFDSCITWERIVKVIEDLADLNIVERNYRAVRTFRRDLTLRVSQKHSQDVYKFCPKPVEYVPPLEVCRPSYGIPRYLHLLDMFLRAERLGTEYVATD